MKNFLLGNFLTKKPVNKIVSFDKQVVFEEILLRMKKRKPVIVITCGAVTDSFDNVIKEWAEKLYKSGCLSRPDIEKHYLLPIISGDDSVKRVMDLLLQKAMHSDKIISIDGIHQMKYNESKAIEMFDMIMNCYADEQLRTPIMLNVPEVICSRFVYCAPGLSENAIWFTNKEIKKGTVNQPLSQEINVPTESNEGMNHTTETSEQMPKDSKEEKELPWYMKDGELLEIEKKGMVELLKGTNSQFQIGALNGSKRLYWKFRLIYEAKRYDFDLDVQIVYSKKFSRNNPMVGIVINNADEQLNNKIRNNYRCEEVIKDDSEFKYIFLIRKRYERKNQSAAAAILNGLYDILEEIR